MSRLSDGILQKDSALAYHRFGEGRGGNRGQSAIEIGQGEGGKVGIESIRVI